MPLCPLPITLTQSKANLPPCTIQPGFCPPPQEVLGSPCLIPTARLLSATMPRMLRAGGHPAPHGTVPGTVPIVEMVAAHLVPGDAFPLRGGWRVLPTCLVLCPQNLGAGALGLLWLIPLLNSGISKRRDVDLWVVAGSLPARCHTPWWHPRRTLHPSPEPAGRPRTFFPVTAHFGQDHDGADKSIPQQPRWLMSICPPLPRWVCGKCLSPNPPLGPAVPENRQKVV